MNENRITINGVEYIRADTIPTCAAPEPHGTPFQLGKSYLIRTVTMTHTGKLVAIVGGFAVLDCASWIADTGRFSAAIATGELNEVEPMGDGVIVPLASIIDATIWRHALPTVVK